MNGMNALSKDDFKMLMQKRNNLCLSLFMPTYRAGAEIQQNQIRLRHLLKEAEEKLIANGLRPQDAKTILEPIQGLSGNVLFWRKQSDGLAIFLSPGNFYYYPLPIDFMELVVVGDHFHIKPLLPLLGSDARFFILALSQGEVKLLEGTRLSLKEIDLETLPRNLVEALQYDEMERQIRFHAGISGSGGSRGTMISGHGADINAKDDILKYFRKIDRGLHDFLKEERVPLILAGVDYLFPIYREVNTYPYLIPEGVSGNPKGIHTEQLHKQAWAIIKPHLQKTENNAIAQYKQSLGTGLTSTDVKEIIQAAYHGRIGYLFVTLGLQIWGKFEQGIEHVYLADAQAGNEDIVDFATIQTFLNGGSLFALPQEKMPDKTALAAIFRY
jgi:hypothetical protein